MHFDHYIKFYKARGDSSSVARALYCIATIHADRGEEDKNLALQLRIVKIYERLGDQHRMANTLNGIGNIYWRTGKYDFAMDSYKQANRVYSSLNSMARYGMGLQNLANVFVSMRQYDSAKAFYLEALTLVKAETPGKIFLGVPRVDCLRCTSASNPGRAIRCKPRPCCMVRL